MSPNTIAIVDGNRYEIPDIWLAGFCQSHDCSVEAAVRYWHYQSELGKRAGHE